MKMTKGEMRTVKLNKEVLLVDDDQDFLEVYSNILEINHYKVTTAPNGRRALEVLNEKNIPVVVTDIIMPKMDGLELLKHIKEKDEKIQVIMLTAEGSIDGAVESMRLGAFTYLEKPVNIEDLLVKIKRAQEIYDIHQENISLKEQLIESRKVPPLMGESSVIKKIKEKIEIVASTETSVLITGESGTGKEIVASGIHYKSNRANKPFIKVNCAALAESVLESELFGHEKGAFTGANKTKKGRFEMADGGTIMLDEIGEMPLGIQAKLLRVLQEKELERVGGTETIKTDFRVVAITNRDLELEISNGRFREDLFYRINVLPIYVPPLKDRKEDIPLLCDYFLRLYCLEMRRKIAPLSDQIMNIFVKYDWPGNVRELKNVMERLVVLVKNQDITIEDIPEYIKSPNNETMCQVFTWKEAKDQFEEQFFKCALKKNDGNVADTAKELELSRKSLYEKINKYNIICDI